jgi:hypothetical protein
VSLSMFALVTVIDDVSKCVKRTESLLLLFILKAHQNSEFRRCVFTQHTLYSQESAFGDAAWARTDTACAAAPPERETGTSGRREALANSGLANLTNLQLVQQLEWGLERGCPIDAR